jgi:hypothetical protein
LDGAIQKKAKNVLPILKKPVGKPLKKTIEKPIEKSSLNKIDTQTIDLLILTIEHL